MPNKRNMRRIFISHGHNELVKLKLRNFVKERLSLEPIILAEQPDDGLTVIEKLERFGRDCDFSLIVLTSDDETPTGGGRARQNVIHELGYFHGVLGRNRVLLLKEKGVELFSNISGLVYKEFPSGAIESIFEDVRLALESGDVSGHTESVPVKMGVDFGDLLIAATTPHAGKMADRFSKDLGEIASAIPTQKDAIRSIRNFIESELQDAQEAIASCEQDKRDSMKAGKKEPNEALGAAFQIMAYATIISDMRKKKRATELMLKEMDSWPPTGLPIREVLSKLEQIARFYLK